MLFGKQTCLLPKDFKRVLFKKIEEEIPLKDVLEFLTTVPPLKYPLSTELEEKLPNITGALLLVLAKIMKEVDPDDRAVDHTTIERSKKIMDLLL